MKLCLDLHRIVKKIRKPPLLYYIDRLSARFYSAFFPENIQRLLQITRINIRCSLNDAVASVFKLYQGDSHILRLDIIMVQPIRHPHYFINLAAHHPTQQVNVVNTLVHQCTAVLLPGTPPGRSVVVLMISAPPDMSCPIE